jgi:aminoglycoside 3-N-acetyltransferase
MSEIREKKTEKEHKVLKAEDLIERFRSLGLREGNIVIIHSSFKSFGGVEGGPQTVIDALLKVLGKEGTLIMPTFNFDWCEESPNGVFDLGNTPSKMGILTEIVRKMPGAKRTLHPFYSFAIYGKFADKLSKTDNHDSFGKDSIFAKIHELNAWIMIIGLTYNQSMTFFHYIEQQEGVDYRFMKDFSGWIIANGGRYRDTYKMLVRDINKGAMTAVDPMGEVLEKRGVVKIRKIGQSLVKLMRVKDVYKITAEEMKNNPRFLYSIS